MSSFNPKHVPSPSYVIDKQALERNLKILAEVQNKSGAKILLALKAFSMFEVAPLISEYLSGTCASGLYEAKLGREFFGGEVHTYSPAFKAADIDTVLSLSDHVVFNSFTQWNAFKNVAFGAQKDRPSLKFGLRVNPEHSEATTEIYDPCAPSSRMGITLSEFDFSNLEGISGLHFHTLCEQNFEPLSRTLDVIEKKFSSLLPQLNWINFGGGHHITSDNYDRQNLINCVKEFSQKYHLQVYLEPGEAIAIDAGYLVAEVLDVVKNKIAIAILDASATCHMPDVLEMPYRPLIKKAELPNVFANNYRLAGPSCLTGDVIGDYSFAEPLQIGDRLVFEDMAIYTMVKNTTFNGVPLPSIVLYEADTDQYKVVKQFDYTDFKSRLS